MINQVCELQFPNAPRDYLQMLTVASSFPLPQRTNVDRNEYFWTGFPGLSHDNLHDIVYFIRDDLCNATIFDYHAEENKPILNCNEFDVSLNETGELPLLGNFNYDVARSHQSYNLPIYGMEADQTAVINIDSHNTDMEEWAVSVRNVRKLFGSFLSI